LLNLVARTTMTPSAQSVPARRSAMASPSRMPVAAQQADHRLERGRSQGRRDEPGDLGHERHDVGLGNDSASCWRRLAMDDGMRRRGKFRGSHGGFLR
jgi:hypothetical protein